MTNEERADAVLRYLAVMNDADRRNYVMSVMDLAERRGAKRMRERADAECKQQAAECVGLEGTNAAFLCASRIRALELDP